MSGTTPNSEGVVRNTRFPTDPDALRKTSLLNEWWYYSVELLPGVVARGQYPESIPMLPRMLLRRCDLKGMACLDLGSMEGLMPALMARGNASRVLAVDGVDHCLEKLSAVQHYYGVSFEYKTVGAMYDLSKKLGGEGFDLINCSGLLYHVLSPLMVLCGVRGALRRNGLMIVSTNVIVDREAFAHFNAKGELQEEDNTFWYLSTGLLDYALRYLKLAPLDCLYQPHETMATDWRMKTAKRSGYLAVLCRAVDGPMPANDDGWMDGSAARSWEYDWIPDWQLANSQPVSRIGAKRSRLRARDDLGVTRWERLRGKSPRAIDLTAAVEESTPITHAAPGDSHRLSLRDFS